MPIRLETLEFDSFEISDNMSHFAYAPFMALFMLLVSESTPDYCNVLLGKTSLMKIPLEKQTNQTILSGSIYHFNKHRSLLSLWYDSVSFSDRVLCY